MEKGMDKSDNLKEVLDNLKKNLGRFSTDTRISYYIPEILNCIDLLEKRDEVTLKEVKQALERFEGLEKRLNDLKNQSLEQTLEEAYKHLEKAKGKIISHWFTDVRGAISNYLKTEDGKKLIDDVLLEHKDPFKNLIRESIKEDKGLLPSVLNNLKFYITTRAGIAGIISFLLAGGAVLGGIYFVLNRTDVGKIIGYQNRTDKIEAEIYAPRRDAKGRIIGKEKESRIDKIEAKYKGLEKSIQDAVPKKEVEALQGKYYETEIKPKFDAYEKRISELEGAIDSDKKEDEKTKTDYENKAKELEKRIEKYEKSNQGLIKKISPLK